MNNGLKSAIALCAVLVLGGVPLLGPAAIAAPVRTAEVARGSDAAASSTRIWHPRRGVTWQWQLSGKIDTTVAGTIYDVDTSVSAKTVALLHRKGHKVVCYISAGSWENYRSDAGRFPHSVLGKTLDGWPAEKWLDVRRTAVLKPLMAARMDVCKRKGFDGIEADNVDGYTNDTGFALTGQQQRTYNLMLARLAHARGLAIGLKNDVDQVKILAPYFEFAVNEQCVQYAECDGYRAFLNAGKPVLNTEYYVSKAKVCATAKRLHLSSIRKKLSLTAWRRGC